MLTLWAEFTIALLHKSFKKDIKVEIFSNQRPSAATNITCPFRYEPGIVIVYVWRFQCRKNVITSILLYIFTGL